MSTTKRNSRRRLDLASLALLCIGLLAGIISYLMIQVSGVNALVIVPSVVAVTLGASSLVKLEAPRE